MAGVNNPTYRRLDDTRGLMAYQDFVDDFIRYNAADWVITKVEAGAGSFVASQADVGGGVLLLTNDAADDDSANYQSVAEAFTWVSGKKLGFEARFKVSDATQSDVVIGLHIRDTSPIASAPSDGIYFRKDDGDTLLDFVVSKASTASTLLGILGSTVLANDTWTTVGFYYDGSTRANACIQIFKDGNRVGSLPITNAPTTELALSFAIQNGEAVAKTMSIDYIRCFQERVFP